jgi:hypothetical protein
VEFAKYEKDTGLLGEKYRGAPSSDVPQYLTPVAIFTLAVAIVISSMPPAIVQYLVFAIMFSAPAVGVVAFFAQSVDASSQCNFDWTPVIQTSSKHFVVRGGEIPFEVTEPFTLLHLALLVATLAGLAVMWRLVDHFMDPNADGQRNTLSDIMRPDSCMFTLIYPHTVEDASYRTLGSFGMHYLWSVLLDASGYQPYCVNINCTVFLRGRAYRWKFFPPHVRRAMRESQLKIARRRSVSLLPERVRGFDDPTAGHYDYVTLQYGAWVPVDPESNAPPLVNVEAVHHALVIQAIIKAPHQTDHARDKIPGRTSLLNAWMEQAAIPGFDVINTYIADVAIDHPSNEGDTKSYGEAAHNYYYYKTSVSRLGMDDHPDLSPPRITIVRLGSRRPTLGTTAWTMTVIIRNRYSTA